MLAFPSPAASSSGSGAFVATRDRVGLAEVDEVGLAEGEEVGARPPQLKAWADASGAEATERFAELSYPGMISSELYEYLVPFRRSFSGSHYLPLVSEGT